MGISKKTLVMVGSTLAIATLADIVVYSLGASIGGKLSLHIPKGKELGQMLAIGVAMGVAVSYISDYLSKAVLSKEEANLDNLINQEKKRLEKGANTGLTPVKVNWVPKNNNI